MASTLLEAAINQRVKPKAAAIIQMFDQESPVLEKIPMTKIDGRVHEYSREITLPSVGWRAVNNAWTESTGVVNPFFEHLKILGGECKVDRFIQKTTPKGARDEMTKQIKLKVRALANEWDRAFFEGSELSDVNEMVGLRTRLTGNQLVRQASGGGTLTLAKLDEALDAVPFANKVIYLNRKLRRKLTGLCDAATGSRRIDESRDAFGRQNDKYAGFDLRIVETRGSGATILDFDEDPGDGVSDCASIYIVAFGDELVHGIYNNGGSDLISYEEMGEMQSAPTWLTRFEGYYGMAIEHPRSASRLYGITDT